MNNNNNNKKIMSCIEAMPDCLELFLQNGILVQMLHFLSAFHSENVSVLVILLKGMLLGEHL